MNTQQFPKVERDGKVAVLYSPGFGAGWSTWADNKYMAIMTMHADIVQALQRGDLGSIEPITTGILSQVFPDDLIYIYAGGIKDLTIDWVDKGCQFEVEEYDGSESINIIGSREYLIA